MRPFTKQQMQRLYTQAHQAVHEHWTGELLAAQCSVLKFIIERTVRYHKLKESIPYRHFLHGVVQKKNGERVIAGLPHSKRTILRAIAHLENIGLIEVGRTTSPERGHEQNVYQLNCKMLLDRSFKKRKINRTLRAPRVLSSGAKGDAIENQGLCHREPTNIQNDKYRKVIRRTRRLPSPPNVADGAIGMDFKKTPISKPYPLARAHKRTSIDNQSLTYEAVLNVWQTSMHEYFPNIPVIAPTRSAAAMLLHTLHSHLHGFDIKPFLEWAVENWEVLRNGGLSYLNKHRQLMGLSPDLSTLGKYMRHFAKGYADYLVETRPDIRKNPPDHALRMELLSTTNELDYQRNRNRGLEQQITKTRDTYDIIEYLKQDFRPRFKPAKQIPVTPDSLAAAERIYNEPLDPHIWPDCDD